MRLDSSHTLTYIVSHEAWYYEANRKGGTLDEGNGRGLYIQSAHDDGGVSWDFRVVEHTLGGKSAVQLRIFDDAFAALAMIPEFFSLLVRDAPDTITDVQAILDSMGAVDATERETPYLRPTERDVLVAQLEDAKTALRRYDLDHENA